MRDQDLERLCSTSTGRNNHVLKEKQKMIKRAGETQERFRDDKPLVPHGHRSLLRQIGEKYINLSDSFIRYYAVLRVAVYY